MVAIETLSSALSPSSGPLGRTGWRLDRVTLPLSTDAHAVPQVVALHPRLTVLAAAEVSGTADRLADVLGEAGSGVHVEFTVSSGPSFVLFRPLGARHRLIDIDAGQERPLPQSLAALSPMSRPRRTGASGSDGGAGMASTPERAAASPERRIGEPADQAVVRQLAQVDQVVLWTAADRVCAARADVSRQQQPAAGGGAPMMVAPPPAAPRRGLFRRKPKPPVSVSESPGGPARELQDAEQYWRLFAGDVDVAVAQQQRARIEAASALLVRLGALAAVGRDPEPGEWRAGTPLDPAEVPAVVCALVPENSNDAGPHLVTVPGDAEPDAASMLLEQLANIGLDRQLIIVTSAEPIIEWARLESHVRRATLLHI